MGVGGGFFLVPAMIYLLGMPTILAVGTSLFQIIFVTSIATFLHAITNQTVDVMLALILLLGAVFGAQLGSLLGAELRGEQLRALLGIVVVSVAAKMGFRSGDDTRGPVLGRSGDRTLRISPVLPALAAALLLCPTGEARGRPASPATSPRASSRSRRTTPAPS